MKTSIEWTDFTFNIAWGCIKVSPGCENCYAETLAKRTGHKVWGPAKTTPRRTLSDKYWQSPLQWNEDAARDPSGGVACHVPGRLVFCSSMADVFEDHPTIDAEREKLWSLIRVTPHLTWQLLTKRPERLSANLPADWGHGYPNVWLGTSIEDQPRVDRVWELINVPAAVHFVSAEPLLGPLTFEKDALADIDWLIIGGESGAGARPFDLAWARSLLAQCDEYATARFVKQLGKNPVDPWSDTGALVSDREPAKPKFHDPKGGDIAEWPADLRVREFPGEEA